MIAEQSTSIERFFDCSDEEKQFILKQIQKAVNPEKTMQNYRKCLEMVNSNEKYQSFKKSGFFVLERDDKRAPKVTLEILEKHFDL